MSELGALGADVRYQEEGLWVKGGADLRGAAVRSHWDHRIAMALAVAGLAAAGSTVIDGWEAVATSYPGFETDLERLCGS
jgi:3-phosphoshikimate 1-carboxyvinyltransferase